MRAPAVVCIALVAGTLLAGCNGPADPDSLYPLTPGLTWHYRVTLQRAGEGAEQHDRTMTNVAREYFAGEDNIAIRRNEHGTRYYVARREDGLYRVAVKSVSKTVPIMDQPPVKILPLPAETGATWRQPAHTYMLDRAKTFISEHTPDNTVMLDYRIEATDAEVRVPAGHYSGCVLVIGQTTFHLGSGVGFAPSDVPIVQKEWYCPGVGLVRLSRDERLTSDDRTITGGHMEFALTNAPG